LLVFHHRLKSKVLDKTGNIHDTYANVVGNGKNALKDVTRSFALFMLASPANAGHAPPMTRPFPANAIEKRLFSR
jgi:hypothetical protein